MLTCYYNKNLPTMLLKPVKVEMLNLDPDLYLFHDVITDKEMEHVKKLARPQVSKSIATRTLQSRTQSPQALWPAVVRKERQSFLATNRWSESLRTLAWVRDYTPSVRAEDLEDALIRARALFSTSFELEGVP